MTRSVSASAGALIVIGMRWTDRLIGFVSTVILARLLAPEDFGVIAMASLVIGLIDVLLDMGVSTALIQNRNATQDDYDAAWTLRLIQSTLAALIVFAAADPAAAYFNDPRVTSVIQVLALSFLLSGCENIGVVTFQKKMEFGVEFRFVFIKRITGFVMAMAMAWYLQSYWALVIGSLSGRAMGVGLSYVMHPMRPRLSLIRMRAMISFSTWNLVRGIAGYLNDSLHRFVVGGREPATVMGAYALGSEIAALPSTEVLSPLSRVLFPMFVELKDNLEKLKRGFILALGIQTLVGIPAGTGIALVARELVLALLGEKWIAAVPFVQIMGAVNIIIAIGASGAYMLLALGRAKVTALYSSVSVLLFAMLAVVAIPQGGAMAIATLRLVVAAFALLIFICLIKRELPALHWLEMLRPVWRPLIAAAIMAGVLLECGGLDAMPAIVQLLLKIIIGATVYILCLLALWRIAGGPDGAEAYLLEKAKVDGLVRGVLRLPSK